MPQGQAKSRSSSQQPALTVALRASHLGRPASRDLRLALPPSEATPGEVLSELPTEASQPLEPSEKTVKFFKAKIKKYKTS